MNGSNKAIDKVALDQFKLTSLSAIGAKSLAKQYVRFGYKLISQKYDEKKQVYISTFK